MKSDPHFYKIFKACPELFCVFAPVDSAYRFDARVFKDIDRSCDGVFESDDLLAITYITEFQVKRLADVYPRIFLEMAAYQLENPKRVVRGVLIFITEDSDPKPETWWEFSQTCGAAFRVVYLDEIIRGLPYDHPLSATFAPLLEKNRDVLQQEAAQRLTTIRKSELKTNQRETLEEVFLSWLTQRFEQLTKKEIRTMFGFDTPVEETVFYKEVFQEGETKGKLEGEVKGEVKGKIKGEILRIEKEITSFRGLQSYLPVAFYTQRLAELNAERSQLKSDLAKIEESSD